jgi:DNA-binding response OmpR family regulator
MGYRTSILIYGRDPVLLETRRLILELSGYSVTIASDLAVVQRTIESQRIDLLLLCHSLSMEECGRAIALSASNPSMKNLVLIAGKTSCHSRIASQVFDSMEGPARLVSAVKALADSAIAIPA